MTESGRDRGTPPPAEAAAPSPVRDRLRAARPGRLHVIDPYKVPLELALEKARAVAANGLPAIIVGSTDYHDFDRHVGPFVAAIKAAVELPVLTHFPPRRGHGFPVARQADGLFMTAVLNSRERYYLHGSSFETFHRLGAAGRPRTALPEPVLTAGLTFDRDEISEAAVAAVPAGRAAEPLRDYGRTIATLRYDAAYLYSRYGRVGAAVCSTLRSCLDPEQLLFVSGGIGRRQEIDELLDAGADFVVFGSALEHDDWRATLAELV